MRFVAPMAAMSAHRSPFQGESKQRNKALGSWWSWVRDRGLEKVARLFSVRAAGLAFRGICGTAAQVAAPREIGSVRVSILMPLQTQRTAPDLCA
jgi:hypothetical protein